MRQAFVDTIIELARRDEQILLLNGDLGFSVLEPFIQEFPDRSFNMGVAEANMIGTAAGLALDGYTVFVYSIIPFVTMRVFEQVRNDIALQNMNVKIVGVGSGFTYGQLGPTHHSIEDIAVMRALPNMTVVCPGDPAETQQATRSLVAMNGPAYLRIGKKGEPQVHEKKIPFKLGKGIVVRQGADGVLFATGNMLRTAADTAELLSQNGIKMSVVSIHTIKPLDEKLIVEMAQHTKNVFTLEEHTVLGGLGSAVAEVILEHNVHLEHFQRFGVQDVFTYVAGSQDYLRAQHKLLPSDITRAILKKLSSR